MKSWLAIQLGYSGMAAACQVVYGPLAMIATTQEYILSPNVLAPGPEIAWINPTIITAFIRTSDNKLIQTDFSGVSSTAF